MRVYRTLEETLEELIPEGQRKRQSIVKDFLDLPQGKPFKSRLELCREVRNILTHNAEDDGEAVVEPSEDLLNDLRDILDYIRAPAKAIDIATPHRDIMTARSDYFVLRLIRDMQASGFSHVPVMKENVMTGIFSVSTLFTYAALSREGLELDESTRLSRFSDLLPPDRHRGERYVFIKPDMDYHMLREAFSRDVGRNERRRLAVAFVTEGGDMRDRLLGMITPWDVISKVNEKGMLSWTGNMI